MSSYPPPSPKFRRLRAISTPCPSCLPISPKAASIAGCLTLFLLYLAWSAALWVGCSELNSMKALSTGTATSELVLMTRFPAIAALFASTMTVVSFGAFVTSVVPQREFAKWFSRGIWIGWLVNWSVGIFGVVVFLSSEAWIAAGCGQSEPCWPARQKIRIGISVALFLTLGLVFWLGVVLSAYVHTLHPHLFFPPDGLTDDEYSDDELHADAELEDELLRSDHPYAADALAMRRRQRSEKLAPYGGSASRRRSPRTEDEDDSALPPAAMLYSPDKRRSSSRRGFSRAQAREQSSEDEDDSARSSSEEEEAQQRRLIGGGSGRGRRMSVGADSGSEIDSLPAYEGGSDRRRRSFGSVDEERSLGRSRSRSASRG
ncbi:hypothetical protein JCM8097_004592 [Rhodosporidiobolus ruineniae]